MARKKQQQNIRGQPTAAIAPTQTPTSNSTKPNSTPTPTPTPSSLTFHNVNVVVCFILLAALYSPLSQLILAPVYGSIPSSAFHKYGVTTSALLAFAIQNFIPTWVENAVPSFAFWIPSIQFILILYSDVLGNLWGPLVTEIVTVFPLITLSLFIAMKRVIQFDLSFLQSFGPAGPSIIVYIVFTFIQRLLSSALNTWIGSGFLMSRIGHQLWMATTYTLLIPQAFWWPAIPSIAFTMIGNPHNPLLRTTAVLNNTLALYDYTVLERHESNSGYISVLQDMKNEFRVMRCDHSLLGGEWQVAPPAGVDRKVGEPIYAVFTMLEALRLIEPPSGTPKIADNQAKALSIGLGIGTAPSAFIAHGIDTTIVELDPVVHYYAGKYFNLPKNHSYYIGDAVNFVHSRGDKLSSPPAPNSKSDLQYDYIIHDTFTGGAIPTSLFTKQFLTSLSTLLTPTGTIAINYAGDLNMPPASTIYRTITSIFTNCRLYREDPEPSTSQKSTTTDFTNLIYFCRSPQSSSSSSSQNKISFRTPVPADYLGSGARKMYLLPKHEITNPSQKFTTVGPVLDYTDRRMMMEIEKWRVQSARGHWKLMRGVIRREVWEAW